MVSQVHITCDLTLDMAWMEGDRELDEVPMGDAFPNDGGQSFPSFAHSAQLTRPRQFSSVSFSVPPDVVVDHCMSWQEAARTTAADAPTWPQHYDETSAEFELPISSEKLFLLARGMAAGGVTIQQSGEGHIAKVKIVARYRNFEALQEVEVCAVNRGEGDNGVGIFVSPARSDPVQSAHTQVRFILQGPAWVPWRGHGVSFTVYLDLPLPQEGSALTVKSLETDMPLFAQVVGDLQNGVHFNSISLKTAHMPISVGVLVTLRSYPHLH